MTGTLPLSYGSPGTGIPEPPSPQQHRNVIEQIADAMQDDPFTDDIHQQGTSQQRMRAMHYASIAFSILAPSPSPSTPSQ